MADQPIVIRRRVLSPEKTPKVDKIIRDGETMYAHARYVIVIDKDGNVVEEINRQQGALANFLVVLAPFKYKNAEIYQSVVLEVGLGRASPYKQVEKHFDDDKKIAIKGRTRVARLSDEGLFLLTPVICSAIQNVIDEETSHRKNLIYYTKMTPTGSLAKWGKVVIGGMFITISLDDPLLAHACLVKNFEARKRGHLTEVANITRENFNRLKYAHYPKGELKRFKVVQELLAVLKEANYPEYMVEVIREKLGKPNTKTRGLFDLVFHEFNIKFAVPSETDQILLSLKSEQKKKIARILEKFPLSVITHPKRVKKKEMNAKKNGTKAFMHAKECVRVEVLPSKKAIDAKHPVGPDGVRVVHISESFIDNVSKNP
jgi:hypothetical protein